MFEAERIYSQRNHKTGMTEWFFYARECSFGPFSNEKIAKEELDNFIRHCVKNQADGGRKPASKTTKLSLEPMHEFVFKRRD